MLYHKGSKTQIMCCMLLVTTVSADSDLITHPHAELCTIAILVMVYPGCACLYAIKKKKLLGSDEEILYVH